jgi:signal transduction histidine kinase
VGTLTLLSSSDVRRTQAELLFGLARAVIVAERVEDVYSAALDALDHGLRTPRASVLTYGSDSIMRFRAWRGLSDEYRAAVEGHSPWARDTRDAEAIDVPDVAADPHLAPMLPVFRAEGIAALAFIPLIRGSQLIGKFMLYQDAPRALTSAELDLARAIADHVAAAVARFTALDELRANLHFHEMFVGILGHDLRNPLNAIVTSAQLALMRSSNEKLTKPLSRILTSSGRMSRMIDQVLDFTRMRVGGGIPIEPRPMDVVPVLRQILDELEDAHPDRALRLAATGNTTGSWDADRLAQVFSNLVANALQHGDIAGPVHVRVDGTAPDEVRVAIHNLGVIPPAYRSGLFEPMSGRDRGGARGLGLGLYITREVVQSHGGNITVLTDPVDGTTFAVTLPR